MGVPLLADESAPARPASSVVGGDVGVGGEDATADPVLDGLHGMSAASACHGQ